MPDAQSASIVRRDWGWNYPVFLLIMLPIGLLLANLSPITVAVNDGPLRYAVLGLGTLCMVVIPAVLFWHPPSRTATGRFVAIVCLICVVEVMNFLHLGAGDGLLLSVAMRCVAYVYILSGFAIAATIPSRDVKFPLLAEIGCVLLATGASLVWLRYSASTGAEGSRFTGSDELHPVGLGLTFGVSTIVCFSILFTSPSKLVRLAIVPACILLLLCVLSTGSRGTLISLACVLSCAALSTIENVKSLFGVAMAGIVTITAIVLAIIFVPSVRDQLDFVVDRFMLGMEGDMDTSQLIRKEIRAYYFDHVDEWILFGEQDYDLASYPHNVFLELIIRYGLIVGGAIAVALVACVIRSLAWLIRRPKRRQDAVCFLITTLGLYSFVLCQLNLSLEINRGMWLFVAYWLIRPAESDISA